RSSACRGVSVSHAGSPWRPAEAARSASATYESSIVAIYVVTPRPSHLHVVTYTWGPASAGFEEIRLKADATGNVFTPLARARRTPSPRARAPVPCRPTARCVRRSAHGRHRGRCNSADADSGSPAESPDP